MGRPRTGSLQRTAAGTFKASIATGGVVPGTARVAATFRTELAARRWLAAARACLDHRQPPPDPAGFDVPPRFDVPSAAVLAGHWSFEEAAWRWWHFHYEEQRRGAPERAAATARHIRRHLIPYFGPRLWLLRHLDTPDGVRLVERFSSVLAGQRTDGRTRAAAGADGARLLTLDEIRTLPGARSKSTVNRRRREGRLRPATVDADGRERFRLDDVIAADLLTTREVAPAGVGSSYAGDILWVLHEIVGYGLRHQQLRTDPVAGVGAVRPDANATRRAAPRRDPEPLGLVEVARVARHLHVVHQLVLWMLRVLGLRIGEAYGPRVGDLVDLGTHGLLTIRAQGGRTFTVRDDDGSVTTVTAKETLKTRASRRVLVVPGALLVLLRIVIRAYHTDPETGEVDPTRRLVPGLDADDVSGQAAFRAAFAAALHAEGLSSDHLGYRVSPKLLRASLITSLSVAQVDAVAARRFAGHRPGDDVHALHYILDDPSLIRMRAAAEQIDADVEASIGALAIPTLARPQFGHSTTGHHRRAYSDTVLAEAGWQLDPSGPDATDDDAWLDAAEAARELDLGVTTVRRMLRDGVIPATHIRQDGKQVWRVRRGDVHAYRDAQPMPLPDLADELGVGYHELRTNLLRSFPDIDQDPATGRFLLTCDHVSTLRSEYARIARLRERAMTVAEAAHELRGRAMPRTVRGWVHTGKLEVDPETDFAGVTYVTRASVDAAKGTEVAAAVAPSASHRLGHVAELAGLTVQGVNALVRAGMLETTTVDRHREITHASLTRWVHGYRPDLIPRLPC